MLDRAVTLELTTWMRDTFPHRRYWRRLDYSYSFNCCFWCVPAAVAVLVHVPDTPWLYTRQKRQNPTPTGVSIHNYQAYCMQQHPKLHLLEQAITNLSLSLKSKNYEPVYYHTITSHKAVTSPSTHHHGILPVQSPPKWTKPINQASHCQKNIEPYNAKMTEKLHYYH